MKYWRVAASATAARPNGSFACRLAGLVSCACLRFCISHNVFLHLLRPKLNYFETIVCFAWGVLGWTAKALNCWGLPQQTANACALIKLLSHRCKCHWSKLGNTCKTIGKTTSWQKGPLGNGIDSCIKVSFFDPWGDTNTLCFGIADVGHS